MCDVHTNGDEGAIRSSQHSSCSDKIYGARQEEEWSVRIYCTRQWKQRFDWHPQAHKSSLPEKLRKTQNLPKNKPGCQGILCVFVLPTDFKTESTTSSRQRGIGKGRCKLDGWVEQCASTSPVLYKVPFSYVLGGQPQRVGGFYLHTHTSMAVSLSPFTTRCSEHDTF